MNEITQRATYALAVLLMINSTSKAHLQQLAAQAQAQMAQALIELEALSETTLDIEARTSLQDVIDLL